MNCKQLPILGLSLVAISVMNPFPSRAHNTMIEYQATEAITIEAKFDNGQPINNAQVIVYAPDNPQQVWQKGLTNKQGKFTFIPDYSNEGNWSIKVRSAGHGSLINIPITSNNRKNSLLGEEKVELRNANSSLSTSAQNNHASLSLTQKLMMAIMGGWGFVGTALFFSRKNKIVN
jgi:nickel transport protein